MRPDPDQQHTDLAGLCEVTTAAAEIFTAPARRAAAVTYLRQRGINPNHLPPDWQLGYAPPGWTRLVDALRGDFGEQTLVDAGLARLSSRGSLIDAFRERVIFPVHHARGDLAGQVAGFIGRDLSGYPGAPKYLNSRHSALYVKSELLYGLHEGLTRRSEQARQPVLVEGPLYVLAVLTHASNSGNPDLLPVAPSGTAVTIGHTRLLAQLTAHHHPGGAPIVVALDPDSAGQSAALHAGERLRAAGFDVRLAALPAGLDPADYLARPEATRAAFTHDHALPLLTVQVEHAIAAQGDRIQWIEGRLGAARAIAANLATYPVSHVAAQIGWIAHTLQIDPVTFTDELLVAYRAQRSMQAGPSLRRDVDTLVPKHCVSRSGIAP